MRTFFDFFFFFHSVQPFLIMKSYLKLRKWNYLFPLSLCFVSGDFCSQPLQEHSYFWEVFISYDFFCDQDTSLSVPWRPFHISSCCLLYFGFEKYKNNCILGLEDSWASRSNNDVDCTFLTYCFFALLTRHIRHKLFHCLQDIRIMCVRSLWCHTEYQHYKGTYWKSCSKYALNTVIFFFWLEKKVNIYCCHRIKHANPELCDILSNRKSSGLK